jgi:hypothetical protein
MDQQRHGDRMAGHREGQWEPEIAHLVVIASATGETFEKRAQLIRPSTSISYA